MEAPLGGRKAGFGLPYDKVVRKPGQSARCRAARYVSTSRQLRGGSMYASGLQADTSLIIIVRIAKYTHCLGVNHKNNEFQNNSCIQESDVSPSIVGTR